MQFNKTLVTLTTIMLLFPIYFALKISPLSHYATWIILVLSIIIPFILRWINNQYNQLI